MAPLDEFVRRVVARARIPRSSARADLERELQVHFEDAAEAHGVAACEHFGNPEEIARDLDAVYRADRRAIAIRDAILLISAGILIVAANNMTLQLGIAVLIGIHPANAFPHLRCELVAFVSLALGYMSLYLEERLIPELRILPAFAINLAGFALVFAFTAPWLRIVTAVPALPFLAGAAVRLFQRTSLRRVWFLGTLLPVVAACVSARHLLNTGDETPLWATVLVRWAVLTIACYLLTLLARQHEARSPSGLFRM